MGFYRFFDNYSSKAEYNDMAYLFGNSLSTIDVPLSDNFILELCNTDNELFLVSKKFTLDDGAVYFEDSSKYLIARFDGNSDFETGNGFGILEASINKISEWRPISDFLRRCMSKNKRLYKLFFFDNNFKDRVMRFRRSEGSCVTINVLRNIFGNGLLALEKVLTGCSDEFFVQNICKSDMSLQNDKKKLRQVLGLPPIVIDFLKQYSFASLYPKFKEVAEKKDVNDTVSLVEYINLMEEVWSTVKIRANVSSVSFVDTMLDVALLSKSTMNVLLNYLHTQEFYYREGTCGVMLPLSEAIEFRDYLSIAKKYNLVVDNLPSNLRAAHFYIQNNICYAEDTQKDEEFQTAVAKYKYLEFENEKYAVVTPKNIDSMINEGMQMHHCIASYVDMVCKGAIVLFLRKKESMDESFVSFEVSGDGEFIQIKGKYDEDIEETVEDSENNEVLDFLKEWQKERFSK